MSEEFVIKDSGKRKEFDSGMVRDVTDDKVMWSLIASGPMFERSRIEIARSAALWLFQRWYSGETDKDYAAKVFAQIIIVEGPMAKRWAIHLTNGAKKYEANNWMKANGQAELDRFRDSAFRHFMQWYLGERDEDHAAAVFFNINGAEYVKDKIMKQSLVEELKQAMNEPLRILPASDTGRQYLGDPFQGRTPEETRAAFHRANQEMQGRH